MSGCASGMQALRPPLPARWGLTRRRSAGPIWATSSGPGCYKQPCWLTCPLQRLAAHRYVVHRCALIGDAAHVVHPLAGQGVNLGLLDAAALAELILTARREREDPGALRVLRRYERWRKSEVAFMSTAISAFDRFLAHGSGPLSRLAQRGLGLVNRSQEIKRFFVSRALGVAGELPRAARAQHHVP